MVPFARMLPLWLVAAAWVVLRGMHAASTVSVGFERIAARALVLAAAGGLLAATAAILAREGVLRERRSSRVAFASAAVAHLALQALLSGVLARTHGHGGARFSVGTTYGPLTVWPSVRASWPEAGLALSVSVGQALLAVALAAAFGAFVALSIGRRRRALVGAPACGDGRPGPRSRTPAAAGAWLPATLFAGACAGCAPTFLAIAAAGGGVLADPLARVFQNPAAFVPTLLQALAPPLALASLLLVASPSEPSRRPAGSAPAVAAAAGFLPLLAVAGFPEGASTTQRAVHDFFLLATAGAILLLVPVLALGLYYAIRYRAGADDPREGPRLSRRGKRAVIGAAVLVPSLVIYGLGVLSFQVLVELEDPPRGTYHVEVTGSQFEWLFTYPDGSTSEGELRVPVNEVVVLYVTTEDVIHSFFVPDLGVRADALPGQAHEVWFRALRTGTYEVHCAEFCGRGHAEMKARVVVVERLP